jgi:hypothetical protein
MRIHIRNWIFIFPPETGFVDKDNHEVVLRIRVVYPDPDVYPSRILTFIHPGSNNSNKREGGKNKSSYLFCSLKFFKIEKF